MLQTLNNSKIDFIYEKKYLDSVLLIWLFASGFINEDGKQMPERNMAREEEIVKEIRLIRIQSKFKKCATLRTAKTSLLKHQTLWKALCFWTHWIWGGTIIHFRRDIII